MVRGQLVQLRGLPQIDGPERGRFGGVRVVQTLEVLPGPPEPLALIGDHHLGLGQLRGPGAWGRGTWADPPPEIERCGTRSRFECLVCAPPALRRGVRGRLGPSAHASPLAHAPRTVGWPRSMSCRPNPTDVRMLHPFFAATREAFFQPPPPHPPTHTKRIPDASAWLWLWPRLPL